MKNISLALLVVLVTSESPALTPAHDAPIRALLERHCLECHGAEKPKKGFRVDQLSSDFTGANLDRWLLALKRIESRQMPPKSKPQLNEHDFAALTGWIHKQADAAESSEGRVVLRRVNRNEYENTVRDLLGIHVELKELLPEDTSAHGFDNVGNALHTSSFLLEKYLEAADKALSLAITNGPQPPLVKKRYDCKEERYVKTTTERVFLHRDDALVFFSSSAWNAVTLGQFYPPDRGTYRFRISAYAHQSDDKPVAFRVLAGPMLMATKNHLVGYFDAPPNEPAIIEFEDHFEARNHINLLPYGLATAQAVNKIGAESYQGPGLAIQWIEVEGPIHDAWPPQSHRRIFGDLPQKAAPQYNQSKRVEVTSDSPLADAETILRRFARRAYRRPATDQDLKPLLALVEARLKQGYSFEQAVRVGLTAVMVSPDFLFLREAAGELNDFALASRLSYFLWSTMPDEELLALAEQGKLSEPTALREQVERMLTHPKAAAFTENFVGQWLGLRDIDFTSPSHILYPEFDEMLKVSMVREAELFFAELLKDDLSIANFVSSDFTMLNGRLAKHYGIEGIDGWAFRKVSLPNESHRGGVLTMAGVLKVTANGTTTSPVMRGTWVLDRILGTPAPPPPQEVPVIEPDIRGATTIREQLAKHREQSACASCHVKIDPPGFALESFDVIGGYRDYYRTTGRGEAVTVEGRRMHYLKGPPVDSTGELDDGRKFANIDELKSLLLEDKDLLARALTVRLVTYATGGAPQRSDEAEIGAIVANVREKNYGLRSLIQEVVASRLFHRK